MKIVIIPDSQSPYLKLLIEALRAENHQVESMTPEGFRSLLYSVYKFGTPDIIHIQWHHQFFTGPNHLVAFVKTVWFFVQWAILHLIGVRFVWTVHNLVNHERRQSRWELYACSMFARVADAIIVHCEAVKATVAQVYRIPEDRLSVVPHGCLGPWYERVSPALTRNDARALLGIPEADFVFLYFGYIREYKGVDDLIEKFAELDDPHLRLMVVGRPASRAIASRLDTYAESDSRLMLAPRFVQDEELPTFIAACNVVAMPYRNSLTSGTAYLATSYARPIIAPRIGCLEEFPEDAGFLYARDDPDGLLNALTMAVRTTPLQAMERAAYQFSLRHPWSLVATKTIEVYRSVIK